MDKIGIFGDFRYRGHLWRSTFLETDPLMTEDDRTKIRIQIADMYLDEKTNVDIKGDSYEGQITTNDKYFMVGTFSGKKFDAKLETNHGKSKLSLLVAKPIDQTLN